MNTELWTWPQFGCAVIGILALIAGGILEGTQAAATLNSTGIMLTSLAIPWPRKLKE